MIPKLKQRISLILVAIFFLGGFTLLLFQQKGTTTIQKPSAKDLINLEPSSQKGFLSGLFSDDEPSKDSLDPSTGIFLQEENIPSQARTEMITYVNNANAAIPLTTEALHFALTELILDQYAPLQDAVDRLAQGRQALQEITPPLDAIAFHEASLILLREYERILRLPLTIPRQDFDPEQLNDDFEKLQGLFFVAKNELRTITQRYGIPLLPKVISFYEQVIGVT